MMPKYVNSSPVLFIGAHPDDIEIGAAGICSLLAQTRPVVWLVCSSGEAGGPSAVRRAEQRTAAERVGAELIHLDLPDRRVDVFEATDEITRVIEDIQPEMVFTHASNDQHQDHRSVAHASLVASRSIPSVFQYESISSTNFEPTLFVEIGEMLPRKVDLLRSHCTQMSRLDLIRWAETTAAYRALKVLGGKYAEGFVVHRHHWVFSEIASTTGNPSVIPFIQAKTGVPINA